MASLRKGSVINLRTVTPARRFLGSALQHCARFRLPTATIFNRNFPFVEEKSANGYRPKTRLSHAWGSVQKYFLYACI